MRDYEVMLLINPGLEKEAVEKATAKVTDLIKKNKGEVKKVNPWDKRKLTYSIAAQSDAHYVLVNFQGEDKTISELDRVLRITDEVLRFMITRVPVDKQGVPVEMKRDLERRAKIRPRRREPRRRESSGRS